MTFKDSLVAQLSPEVRCRLDEGPSKLHEALLKREALLQDQIRHFIGLRVEEFRSFAQHLVEEHSNEQRRQLQDRKDAAAAQNRPPLKSIVRRRPSSANKRVSFSNVPPKVEYYPSSGEDNSEPDSQVLESSDEDEITASRHSSRSVPSPAVPIDPNSAVVVYEPSPDKVQMKAGRDFELKIRRVPDQPMPSKPEASGGYDFSKIQDFHDQPMSPNDSPQRWEEIRDDPYPSDSEDESLARTPSKVPATPVLPHRNRRHWKQPHQGNGAVSFSFDDAFADGMLHDEDTLDTSDDAAKTAPVSLSSSSSSEPDHGSRPPTALTVGSAPIDIHTPLTSALDGDGGPNNFQPSQDAPVPPAVQELEAATPPSSSQPDPYMPPAELDPANLSFSQRMEWEDRFSTPSSRRRGR